MIRLPVDDKGKQKSEIPVDSVRELSQFFSLRPALGGWRVAIIDAVDELNRFGANAILKTLEEPPARGVLFLISHGEQAILPTIRSRCRVLRCGPLNEHETLQTLQSAGVEGDRAETVAQLAPGRPGRALQLEGADAIAASEARVGRAARSRRRRCDAVCMQRIGAAAKSDVALAAAHGDAAVKSPEARRARERSSRSRRLG